MIRLCQIYQRDIFPLLYMSVRYDEHHCYLQFNQAISAEHSDFQIFIFEIAVTAMLSVLKMRFGYWPPITISFPYAEPHYVEQYQANLPSSFQFISTINTQALQLKFARKQLYVYFKEHSLYLQRFYRHQHQRRPKAVGLLQCVLQLLGHHPQATLEQLATKLAMSSATLKRKLAAHGTSYQQLRDLHRQQVAVFQLTEQGKCNEEVARSLHFSDITNFRRAVKRWTGLTPDGLRRKFTIS